MRTATFARHQKTGTAAGWAHPYPAGLFSPFLYADGGDTDGNSGEETGKGDKPGTGEAVTDSGTAEESDSTDWKAEAEKYRALQKKWEARAKENATAAKERDELRKQSMSEQERAVEEASAKARTEERVRLAGKLARQGFLAAAAGRIPHAATVADDLNLAKYVGEDGDIDEKGLGELVERLAPAKPATTSTSDTGDGGKEQQETKTSGRGFDQGARRGGQARKGSSVAAGRELWAERKNQTSGI